MTEYFAEIESGDLWGFLASEGSSRLDVERLLGIASQARCGHVPPGDLDYWASSPGGTCPLIRQGGTVMWGSPNLPPEAHTLSDLPKLLPAGGYEATYAP